MTWKITLKEVPSGHRWDISTSRPPYQVVLNGEEVGEPFYWNMRGYRGVLPLPDGGVRDLGEISLTALRKEVAALNREARNK